MAKIDEKLIEKKTRELITMVANLYPCDASPCIIPKSKIRDFIRQIVAEVQKPRLTEEDLNFLKSLINEDYFQLHGSVGLKQFEQKYERHILDFLKEIGVEVTDA